MFLNLNKRLLSIFNRLYCEGDLFSNLGLLAAPLGQVLTRQWRYGRVECIVDQTADMAVALLVDTTSQFSATIGIEDVEVGLNVNMDKRLVVQNIGSLSLDSCLLVANKLSLIHI